jgi:hypothetical protein
MIKTLLPFIAPLGGVISILLATAAVVKRKRIPHWQLVLSYSLLSVIASLSHHFPINEKTINYLSSTLLDCKRQARCLRFQVAPGLKRSSSLVRSSVVGGGGRTGQELARLEVSTILDRAEG